MLCSARFGHGNAMPHACQLTLVNTLAAECTTFRALFPRALPPGCCMTILSWQRTDFWWRSSRFSSSPVGKCHKVGSEGNLIGPRA